MARTRDRILMPTGIVLLAFLFAACGPRIDVEAEKSAVAQAVDDSIGWAKTKNRDLLFSRFVRDDSMLILQPESTATLDGFAALEAFCDRYWMDPKWSATRYEIRDLRVHLAPTGDVAWISAVLDDCGEYNGQEGCWEDVRWTGVLLKREGRWVFAQQHLSFAADKVRAECPEEGGP